MEFTQEQKLYAEIVQKAWDDADFKKQLVENPVAAIENFTGKKLNLPAGKTFVVRDQTDESAIYINIPAAPKAVDAELNDAQLEAVAGGIIGPGGCILLPPGPWNPTPTFPKDIILY
jgi:hypothetical protein